MPPLPAGLRIETVRDATALARHRIAIAVGFGAPHPHALDAAMPSTLLVDDRVAMFNGYVDGEQEPTATSLCIVDEGMASI